MSRSADEKADIAINAMVSAAVVFAAAPGPVNWAAFSTALGGGVVAIGLCYGVTITRSEGWKLVKQFVLGAGFTFVALNVGSKLFAVLLSLTGFGYVVGVALDAAISSAIAYAVGESARAYFKGEHNKKELGRIFVSNFKNRASPI